MGTNHCLSCGSFQWWGEEEEGEESICWSFITRGRMQSLKKAKRLGVKIEWTVLRLWKCVKFTSLSWTLKKRERERETSECNWLCEENESVWVLKINSWKKRRDIETYVGVFTWLRCVCLQTCSVCSVYVLSVLCMLLRQLSWLCWNHNYSCTGRYLAETSEQNLIQLLTPRKDVCILKCVNDENAWFSQLMQSHLQWQQKSGGGGGGGGLFAAIFAKITNTEETELCVQQWRQK